MATTFTKMTILPPRMSSSHYGHSPPQLQTISSTQSSSSSSLPVRTIPGSYGWPMLGPISDRLDYSWFQGPESFFKTRIDKYKSTVFRTNVPPSFPMFTGVNPNVVAVLDCESFSYLFDMEMVEKKNVLIGDFMPSTAFTGGIRTSVYCDTSEPQHTKHLALKYIGKEVVERGQTEFGLAESETIHNLLFILGFNAFGGFSVFLPALLNAIASDTSGLQQKLCKEVRESQSSDTSLTFDSVNNMPLVQSVVYETLRLNPPVPLQYARARKGFQLSSHDSVFEVKKGELLCGYQPLAMKDPKIFDDPETFKPDRFMGSGKELLNYLYWSNGPQTGSPSESNKQCAAKDYVTISACLIVAQLFRRYDSITGTSSSITAVQTATK